MFTISQEEFNAVSTREGLEKLCNRMMVACVEQTLLMLPRIANELMKNNAELSKQLATFEANNQDVVNDRNFFAQTLLQVEGENPGVSYGTLLDMTARRVREIRSQIQEADAQLKLV